MASSAVYRYFPSRDDLITALIVEAYDSLGGAAEAAAAVETASSRWPAVCRVIRAWALDHPHEYALIYGSPVPGYVPPRSPWGRPAGWTLALGKGRGRDVHDSGELEVPEGTRLPRAVGAEVRQIAQLALPGVPLATVAQALLVWTQLLGQV